MCFKLKWHEDASDYYDAIVKKEKARVDAHIKMLECYGPKLKFPKTDSLRDGIHELRIEADRNAHRLLFAYQPNRKILMLLGFLKKTKKTDKKHIEKAIKNRDQLLKR